jgi:hypothetical protein
VSVVSISSNLDRLSLTNICNGAVPERFERALTAIMKNIRDPMAPAKQKRKMTLEFEFEPHTDRSGAEVTFSIKEKLAGDETVKGNIYMFCPPGGELTACPRDPRQELLFSTGDTDPNNKM